MEGIRFDIKQEHQYSEGPEDGGFSKLLEGTDQYSDTSFAYTLSELSKSPEKMRIIGDGLIMKGKSWVDLIPLGSGNNKEALQAFGRLLAHWNTLEGGNPKSNEMHLNEAVNFAAMLE